MPASATDDVHPIVPVGLELLDALVTYLEDHTLDNGREGEPLFAPRAPGVVWAADEARALFAAGLAEPVGAPGWRRAWVARDASGAIAGHVDLRARKEPFTAHRTLLGMGVHATIGGAASVARWSSTRSRGRARKRGSPGSTSTC
jgi:hypothetical protein